MANRGRQGPVCWCSPARTRPPDKADLPDDGRHGHRGAARTATPMGPRTRLPGGPGGSACRELDSTGADWTRIQKSGGAGQSGPLDVHKTIKGNHTAAQKSPSTMPPNGPTTSSARSAPPSTSSAKPSTTPRRPRPHRRHRDAGRSLSTPAFASAGEVADLGPTPRDGDGGHGRDASRDSVPRAQPCLSCGHNRPAITCCRTWRHSTASAGRPPALP